MRIAIFNRSFETLGGGERRSTALASHLANRHHVTLVTATPVSASQIQNAFGIDLSRVKIAVVDAEWGKSADHFRDYDVFINNTMDGILDNHAPFGILSCMFPAGDPPNLTSYNVVTANSAFTASWIKTLWGCESEIVYSACQDMGPPKEKAKTILSIGRFYVGQNGVGQKNQMLLFETFLKMVSGGLQGWELQLVGTPGTRPQDIAFLEELRAKAKGHPVKIEAGLGLAELRERLRKARFYWHAMGYGTDIPNLQEHFGMTVVEALSAGAIPLAFKSGGPCETIRQGIDGYLWSTPTKLEDFTLNLIREPAKADEMSRSAVERAKSFNVSAYLARMDAIIARAKVAPASTTHLRRSWLERIWHHSR